jgi:hypothetical protein
MPNTIAGVNLAEIAMESLPALQSVFAPLQGIATDFSADISARGESVTTRFPSNPTAQDLSSGYTATGVTTTARTVNLDQFYGFVWGFNDLERSKSSIMLNDLFIQPAATALGRYVFEQLWANVVSANFTATPIDQTPTQFNRNTLIDLSAALTNAGAPSEGRGIITNPTYFGSILKTLNTAEFPGFIAQKADGTVPRVAKFDVYESDRALDNGQNLQAFAFHKSALIMAARSVDATGATQVGVEVEDFVIPGLNLPVQMRRWYAPATGQLNYSLGVLFGTSIGRTEFGIRVVNTD